MAKVKGLLTLVGTIDGINFYLRKGIPTARVAGGGFTRKSIKTSPNMGRVRRSNSELGMASKANVALKMSLRKTLLPSYDGTFHARMMAVLLKVKMQDTKSRPGERTVWNGFQNDLGQQLYSDFLFTPDQPLSAFFKGLPIVSSLGAACKLSGLTVVKKSFTGGADCAKISYFIVDYTGEEYEFTTFESESTLLHINDLPRALPNFEITNLPPAFKYRMAYVSVHFYKNINGNLEIIKGDGMTGLQCLGVYFGGEFESCKL